MKIALCANWGAEKDGIADYAARLADALEGVGTSIMRVQLPAGAAGDETFRRAADEANGADLCHVQFNYGYFNGEMPYRNRFTYFAGRVRVPLVMTAHEVKVELEPVRPGLDTSLRLRMYNATRGLWNAWSRAYHRRMYACLDAIIVHTAGQAEQVRAYVADPDRVVCIPHGIPAMPDAARHVAPDAAKAGLGLAGRAVLTIFGFTNRRKGYEVALDALLLLPDTVALVIGGGPMRDHPADIVYDADLREAVARRGLAGRVVLTGYLEPAEIPEVMAATDLCLAPFVSSGGSGSLSLCLGYRKPVVASDIPANREIAARVPCLELFAAGDSADLAGKIGGLLADRVRAGALAARAGEYADRFAYGEIALRTQQVYETVLSGGKR